jgi:hypothetical protein
MIVAEDVEEQHVADQVHPAPVQEHRGKDRMAILPAQDLGRHQRPFGVKAHQHPLGP